jgi:Holliday junction resolvase
MKAKRPDFLILTKGQLVFVEIERNLIREEVPQIAIQVEEVQKLNQFQLQTGVETVIAFPLDAHGTAWKTIRPSWIVANGTVDDFQGEEFYFVNARSVEKIPLPFQPSI